MKPLLNKAAKAVKLLFSNPRVFFKVIKPFVCKAKSGLIKINGVNFTIDLELDSAMRKMYFGAYEYELTSLIKKILKEGDNFIDIGANVGYISAFALGLVGKTGSVHSFEPVPKYLARLTKVKEDNPDYRLYVNGVAIGENKGKAKIAVTNLPNIGWNTMVPDFMGKDTIAEEIDIDVIRLTDYLEDLSVKNLKLVKIDTEGFEFPVLKGFKEYLLKIKELPIIIIEIAPGAYPHLNYTLSEFSQFMLELGFISKGLDLFKQIKIDELKETTDVVFIPKIIN